MCQFEIQIMINSNDEFQKMWTFLKIRFESIDWINKWAIINRFEEIHYDETKNMMIYNEKLTKIKQEIMNFDIIMIDVFVIKILNNFNSDFHTFFAIKNNEIRIDKKLSQYEKLIQHLEEKKNRLKQKEVIDMTRVDQNINDENNKNDRKDRNIRKDFDDRDREKNDKEDNFDDFNKESNCINCYINHSSNKKHCLHVDLKCRNCKRMNHIVRNCRQKEENRYKKFINKNFDDSNKFIIFDTHIDMINLNAIELIVDRLLSNFSINNWILNSNAIHHCSNNKILFKNLRSTNDVARTTNDEIIRIEIIDSISIQLINEKTLIFTNVRYLSKLIVNLINTSSLHHRNFNFTYSIKNLCNIFNENHFVDQIDMINNVYILQTLMQANVLIENVSTSTSMILQNIFAFVKSTNDLQIWHRRLAHFEYQNVIKNVNKMKNMNEIHDSSSNMFCDFCMKERQQIEIFKVSQTKTKRFLTKIHIDIEDSLLITWRDNKIFVLIKCDDTKMLFFYVCKQKSQIFDIVVNFRIWIELQSNKKLKIVKSKDELLINVFDKWFKKIDIQWKQLIFYTFEQNFKIERIMYTIMTSVRSIMRNMQLSFDMWNLIAEIVIYIKNRIVIFNENNEIAMTFYEAINNARLNVFNFRTLKCKTYTHVSKTTSRHKFDDRSWKSIHVDYDDNNQWKIYNFRTRKIHFIKDVRFDKNYFFYEKNHASSKSHAKTNDEFEIDDFWIKNDDDELKSKFRRRRITNEIDDVIDSKFDEKNENEKFAKIFENSLTQSYIDSNFSNLNDSIFDAEFERFQTSQMSNSSISKITIISSRQSQSICDFVFDDQLLQFEKIFENEKDSFANSAIQFSITIIIRRKKTKKFALSIDREIRIFKDEISRFDYKKLQTSRQFQSKNRANVINNTYNVKQMSESHIHMICVLHAFNNDENFDLDHISKFLNYREIRKSFHWEKWKKIMKIEMISLIENKIWKLIKRSFERVVITKRWMFKLKYDVDERILRYKIRWMIHEYKQKKNIDYNVIWIEIVKSTFFKTLFAFVAKRRLHAEQMNIVTIFLYDLLDENVYVTQFENFVINSTFVCHLIKILYDLKQVFRVWYEIINAFLKKLDLVIFEVNHNVFISKNDKIYVIVYVDDLLIINDNMNFIDFIKRKFDKKFKMIDLNFAQHYLDIEIVRNDDSILLR